MTAKPVRAAPPASAPVCPAAYFHYTRYLNPVTHQRGMIFDVIEWLVRQRRMAAGLRGAGNHAS